MVEGPRYVDVNVFVYWLGGHPSYGEVAREWVRRIEHVSRGFITSSLTIYETIVVLAGLTGRSLRDTLFVKGIVRAFERLRGLKIEPLMSEDLARAAQLMEEHELGYEDALHLAVALRAGASAVVSNDRDWDRTPLPRLF
ncbi:MAG: VapC toxin family PIN domain ribonuclease [Thermoprotei archaeon]|nr:MAG: VapC toxin family PIN domain ribonuclease [Thermoprotei archaeon]RLE94076.1 MAG: VapC toxin family PIN domain ribonuclease [Thermoprotei archaeon]